MIAHNLRTITALALQHLMQCEQELVFRGNSFACGEKVQIIQCLFQELGNFYCCYQDIFCIEEAVLLFPLILMTKNP